MFGMRQLGAILLPLNDTMNVMPPYCIAPDHLAHGYVATGDSFNGIGRESYGRIVR
jgi:hypothetical protein